MKFENQRFYRWIFWMFSKLRFIIIFISIGVSLDICIQYQSPYIYDKSNDIEVGLCQIIINSYIVIDL